jgi:NADH:ubiquinone oxidoreductase subunit 6 (subunit J)
MLLSDTDNLIHYLLVDNFRDTLALFLGALAVYFLLPRPRSTPWAGYLAAAGLALVLTVSYFDNPRAHNPEHVLFYAFSALAILGGVLLITQRNPARAALAFALVVLSTCGLFLLQAAPFLMAATIIIYAGAIIVTFLFVLMLAQQEGPSDADQRSREPLLATGAGFVLLGALLYILNQNYGTRELDKVLDRCRAAAAKELPEEMESAVAASPSQNSNLFNDLKRAIALGGKSPELRTLSGAVDNVILDDWKPALLAKDVYQMRAALAKLEGIGNEAATIYGQLQPHGHSQLSSFSGPSSNRPHRDFRRDNGVPQLPAENTAYLGRSLFTDYLLPVELGGTLLLVAAIGAIAIAYRRGEKGS